jgi:sec-independent protein translocase protein TatA
MLLGFPVELLPAALIISFNDLLIIAIIIVVLFGSTRLPALGKGLGEGIRNFKKGLQGGGHDETTEELDKKRE